MRFQFADFVLDSDKRELTQGSRAIDVGPQVFDLLVYLVENRDRVISKDGLLDAIWGGRVVSESTLTSHINAVRKALGDNGEEQRLIRTIARKGFRFVGDVAEPIAPQVAALPLPDKPSIAVLPFRNLSGDPEQDYFADGVVEDIIAALSRLHWLFVIARNSSFAYKGRSVDAKQVGRELGVRYILEGSFRKAKDRVRITGQLIDATTATHIWAERFEGTLEDVFELQDQLATSVVGAIAPQLESAEIERAKRMPTTSLSAYDCYLRGIAELQEGSRRANDDALSQFYKAIELDPNFASPYAMAAWCIFWRKANGWITDRSAEVSEGIRLAHLAMELGKNDPVALTRSGHALAHLTGDLDLGIALIDRALVLNPNFAAAWFLSAYLRALNGDNNRAIEQFARAMRLSPLDHEMYRMQAGMAMTIFFEGRFDEALSWAEKAFMDSPSFLMVAAVITASHALAGRMHEAQRALDTLRQLDPALRVSSIKDWLDIRSPENVAMLEKGLRSAGLPE